MTTVTLSSKVEPEMAAKFDQLRGENSRSSVINQLIGLYVQNPQIVNTASTTVPQRSVGLPEPDAIPAQGWRIQHVDPEEVVQADGEELGDLILEANECSHPLPHAKLASGSFCLQCKAKLP